MADTRRNFATVRRDRDGTAISNFRPLRADNACRIGPNHEFAEKLSDTFLISWGELPPPGSHSLAGDEIEGEAFFECRPHARGQGFVFTPGISDRENLVDRTAQHGCRIITRAVGEANCSKHEQHWSGFQDESEQVGAHSYLGSEGEGEGAGDDETLPKAKRLISDSRSIADSVSVIVPPGGRFPLSAPGASAMNLSPISPLVLIEAIVSEGRRTCLFTSIRT